MKREFGTKLIEDFLAHQDLRLVADTSGAYIPGHGTPTVIIVGRNQRPVGSTVRAVLGVRGEPGRPDDPAKGIVWTSIVDHVDDPGWDDGWITIADLDRTLARYPSVESERRWRSELLRAIEQRAARHLSAMVTRIGVFGHDGWQMTLFAVAATSRRAVGLDADWFAALGRWRSKFVTWQLQSAAMKRLFPYTRITNCVPRRTGS